MRDEYPLLGVAGAVRLVHDARQALQLAEVVEQRGQQGQLRVEPPRVSSANTPSGV